MAWVGLGEAAPIESQSIALLEDAEGVGVGAGNTTANASATAMSGAAVPTAGSAPGAKAEKEPKESNKESMKAARVQAYVGKIKEFQKLKNQRWDASVEQDLAHKLVSVDELLSTSPEEKEIEHKLRSDGPKNMRIEMDMGREKIAAKMQSEQKAAAQRMKKKEVAEKAERSKAYAQEQKAIQKTIAKYEVLAVPKTLSADYKKAESEYKAAVTTEEGIKQSPEFQSFSEEHHLHKNVEGEPDYPKDANQQGEMHTQAQQLESTASGSGAGTELGESNKRVKQDHIVMGQILKANLNMLKNDETEDETEVRNLANDAKKLDEKLSAEALSKLKKSDAVFKPH